MKKQSKILLGVFAVLIVGAVAALVSTNSSMFQGKLVKSSAINRAEFARLLVVNAGLETSVCDAFSDAPEGVWFNRYACALYNQGSIRPYPDGTFGPSQPLTRAEASRIIHSAFEVDDAPPLSISFRDVPIDRWYSTYINELAALGFFGTEAPIGSDFRPADLLTRSAAATWFLQSGNL